MAKILNTVLSAVAVFMLTFLWIVYCTKDGTTSFCLAAIAAIAAGYLIYRAQNASDKRKSRKNAQSKKAAALGEYLRYGDNNIALISDMMRYYRFDVISAGTDDLVAEKNGKKCYVALRYAADAVNKEELARCVVAARRAHCCKLYLFAHRAEQSLLKQASAYIETDLVDDANLTELLLQSDKMPQLPSRKTPSETRFAPKVAFNRKRFGWYFASSLFTAALSVVSYIKWYTLSWATICLILAIYSLVNRRYNVQPTSVTLN